MSLRRTIPVCVVLASLAGCAGVSTLRSAGVVPVSAPNPMFVTTNNEDQLWERVVETLEDYQFPIRKENRMSRVIETDYKVGASLFEPWHSDSVGVADRLESTLQSVRRRVIITLVPNEQQPGYLVHIEAQKEFEDLPGLAANSPGGATFLESRPLDRDLNLVSGQSAPSGWMSAGRDYKLELSMMGQLRHLLSQNR